MTRLVSTLCLLFLSVICFSQNESGLGSIKGMITTSNNKAAASITVRIKSTKKATLTNNEEGAFTIENIQPGAMAWKYQASVISHWKKK